MKGTSAESPEIATLQAELARMPELFRAAQVASFPGTARSGPQSACTTGDPNWAADRLFNARRGLLAPAAAPAPARLGPLQIVIDAEASIIRLVRLVASTTGVDPLVPAGIGAAQRVQEVCEWIGRSLAVLPATVLTDLAETLLEVHGWLSRAIEPVPEPQKLHGVLCPVCYRRSLWVLRADPEVTSEVVCVATTCRASWAWTRWQQVLKSKLVPKGA